HAFFKALLFLAAGSVIHAMNTNDIKEMGGLAKVMPVTYVTMLVGGLALAGVPPFAGFWSKDEILLEAYHHDRTLFYLGAAGAFVTAFYVFRMIFYTFTGSLRSHTAHPHESPQVMTVPLIVLAAFSGVIGLVGAPWPLVGNMFHRFVHFEAAEGAPFDLRFAALSTAIAGAGILAAAVVYRWQLVSSATLRRVLAPAYAVLVHKYWWDAMLSLIIFLPLVGGIIILFTSKTNETLLKGIALGASLASFVLSLFMTALFKIGGGFQFLELGNWIPSLGIHYHLGVDGLSLPLIVLTALLSLLSVAYSWRMELRLKEYLFLFLLLETGMLGVFAALDFFLFYIFWEITLVPMYFLIGIWGG